MRVTIDSHIGGRSGSVTVTGFNEDDLAAAQVRSEEIAHLSSRQSGIIPPLGPHYEETAIMRQPRLVRARPPWPRRLGTVRLSPRCQCCRICHCGEQVYSFRY